MKKEQFKITKEELNKYLERRDIKITTEVVNGGLYIKIELDGGKVFETFDYYPLVLGDV